MLLLENYRDDVLFISGSSAKVHWHLEKREYPTYDMEKRTGNIKTIKTIQ